MTQPQLYPVPGSVTDDQAWANYLAATTPEPRPEDLVQTLIDTCSPFAADRADAVAAFKRAARALWYDRVRYGRHAGVTRACRAQMDRCGALIRWYDRAARGWAVAELATYPVRAR